jgi:uncharacterized membrane protein
MTTATTLQGTLHVERNMIIDRPTGEVYRFWRDFGNLPKFMRYLQAIEVHDDRHSHWVTEGLTGTTAEWDTEIINEVPDELIAWQSSGDTHVPNSGSVRFIPVEGGESTEVKLTLNFDPPAGKVGELIAKLFGESPNQQVRDGLRRCKRLMETGEIATTEGQPRGNCKGSYRGATAL